MSNPTLKSDEQTVQVDYRPAPMVPISDPLALRSATVRDYRTWAESAGLDVSAINLEAQAKRDLEIVDAYTRDAAGAGSVRAPAAPRDRAEAVVAQSAILAPDQGVTLKAPSGTRYRPGVLYRRAQARGEKWSLALGRIRRLLEGATKHKDIKVVASTAAHPVLALRYLRLYAAYLMRNQLEAVRSRHNPFTGLSDRDAARKFEAEIFAICDASSGFNGPWFIPK